MFNSHLYVKKVGSGSSKTIGTDLTGTGSTGNSLPRGSSQGRKGGGGHGDPLFDVYQVDVHGGALEHAVDEGPLQALVLLLRSHVVKNIDAAKKIEEDARKVVFVLCTVF